MSPDPWTGMPTFEQQQFDNTIPAVLSCLEHCEQCAAHCTDHASAALARCIKLCHACAESCVFCMKALSSWLPQQAKKACEVCADFCNACALECAQIGEDQIMTDCAAACRECAQACRRVAGL
ncbi:MAG TPA: four-helix bundle copper-binding protein [Gammaproteobacteria bacterium]|nr:four-helix bundle copper-binding protein [Gammaproteobacteria bacterium]